MKWHRMFWECDGEEGKEGRTGGGGEGEEVDWLI